MSEAPIVSQAPKIEYALTAGGDVTRTDKDSTIVVAKYDAEKGIVYLVPEWAKFRPAIVRWLNQEEYPVKTILLEGDRPDPSKNIPKAPRKDPQFGDKTPAFVEWLRKYKPNEYKARYGIKGEGTVIKTRKVPDGEGGVRTESFEVHATLALRKTHLTEKVEAGVAGDEDDDTEE